MSAHTPDLALLALVRDALDDHDDDGHLDLQAAADAVAGAVAWKFPALLASPGAEQAPWADALRDALAALEAVDADALEAAHRALVRLSVALDAGDDGLLGCVPSPELMREWAVRLRAADAEWSAATAARPNQWAVSVDPEGAAAWAQAAFTHPRGGLAAWTRLLPARPWADAVRAAAASEWGRALGGAAALAAVLEDGADRWAAELTAGVAPADPG